MGRLVSSLVVATALGFVGLAAACANSGIADEEFPTDAGTDAADGGNRVIISRDSGNSSGGGDDDTTDDDDDFLDEDAGVDSGVDSGPPKLPDPVVGASCPTLDEQRTVACGFCGTKTTICETKRDGTKGWSLYSPCEGESGECAAGSTYDEECNNCGTRTITCTPTCRWNVAGAVCSKPSNTGCSPLTYDFSNAGCVGPDLGLLKVRQCSATCDWGTFSQCSAPPTTIEVGRTVGATSSTVTELGGSLLKVSATSCPANIGTLATAFAYTQVHNPLPTAVTVIIFNSIAPAGKVIDTAIAVYDGDSAPTTVDQRKACVKASSVGNASFTGDAKFASLDAAARKVTIAPNAFVTVYSTADLAGDSGPVRVNVRTDAIAKPTP